MTNILPWNFKPIQLPKLNTNLLSVISLIVLCMMVFVTINTIAEACEELEGAMELADLAATGALWLAEQALEALRFAEDTGIEVLIKIAKVAAEAAVTLAIAAVDLYVRLSKAYVDCLNSQMASNSGSCDSGGNS